MAVGFKSLPFPKNPLMDRRESPLRHCRLSSLPLMSPLQVEALKRLDGERIKGFTENRVTIEDSTL